MKAKDLTTQQRIEILEDVLKKLESGDKVGGLCLEIQNYSFKLFQIQDCAENIIPIFTLENAKKVTEIKDDAAERSFWWNFFENYDFENRIKFVNWMIEQEKSLLNK